MELKRIIARDSRSANEKAMALYGPDVLVIANHSVDGQTELIVAIDIEPHAPASLVREEPGASFQAMEPARVLAPAGSNMQAFEEAMALVRSTQAAGAPLLRHHESEQTNARSNAPQTTAPEPDWQIPGVADIGAPPPVIPRRRKSEEALEIITAEPQKGAVPDSPPPTTSQSSRAKASARGSNRTQQTVPESPRRDAEVDRARELVDLVRAEIASLRLEFLTTLKLQQPLSTSASHPVGAALMSTLESAGVPAALRSLLLDAAQPARDMNDAMQRVHAALATGLQAHAVNLPSSGVHALCGPSGAGKSLMAARWLNHVAQHHSSDRLALISLGDHRPGAWSQTQMLAAQVGVAAYRVTQADTLPTLLNELQDRCLVLVDTPGTDPLRQAQTLRDHACDAALHVVLPADASGATVRRFLQESRVSWQSLLISKLDESEQPWGLIQHLCNHGMAVAGISNSPDACADVQCWQADAMLDRALPPVGVALESHEPPVDYHPTTRNRTPLRTGEAAMVRRAGKTRRNAKPGVALPTPRPATPQAAPHGGGAPRSPSHASIASV